MKHLLAIAAIGLVSLVTTPSEAQNVPSWYRNLMLVPHNENVAGRYVAPHSFPVPSAGSQASARLLQVLGGVFSRMHDTRYVHTTSVNESQGRFHWDCSGMVAWLMARSAPVALASIGSRRPLATDFFGAIARQARGWQRVTRFVDARPGDVLAWRRPSWFPSHNTGHVAIVISAPVPIAEIPGFYLVRIADSSSFTHEDDSRVNRTGTGIGTIMISVDPRTQRGTGYGWFGSQTGLVIPTAIEIGRPLR